ncbi:amino acid ABC transporter substrate-binding protein, PAAT family [Rhizobiales bacterium GAS191]|jgi:octopine/nopaline transport system substrate-binding protein|nr:amino acid ABC transporter substrate-binding protein, PAAT family [Rhizobiales bacterium GAS113]SED91915.1 amino acid ABC transporter substrate-binding protein, PAAT family [Rhizobiales bacterium GAS191]SEE55145.1 amino acid ABC transporter substrate-binding protein, PAAT family [Rhizobiales bacterium GAS188]
MKTVAGAIALALGIAIGLGHPARAEEKAWTKVRIVTEGAFAPWNYTNADGSLGGFEIDLYKDLCRRMKVECTIEAQSFDGMIPALNAGKFDAIIAGMSATPKREEVMAFSVAYGSTGQSFGVLKDGPLLNLPEKGKLFSLASDQAGAAAALQELKPMLKGKVIGVQSASIAATFLDKYLKDTVEIREYKTTEQHDLDLNAGRIDAVMASMAYLSNAVAKPENSAMTITGPRFQGGLLGRGSSVGLRKTDPELKAMFDKAIAEARDQGVIERLSQKYFGYDVTPR